MTSRSEMEAAFEALLFASSDLLSRTEMLALFEKDDSALKEDALGAVLERYRGAREGSGVVLDEVAGGYRLVTRPELHGYLAIHFEASRPSRISMAALETLAIVAYRQPITAPEIQELRGVSSTSVLRTLLENRLIRIAGRKEVVGRPFIYRTTREFLVRFGLNRIKDLPALEELEEALGLGPTQEPSSTDEMGQQPLLDEEERILQQVALLDEAEEEAEETDDPPAVS